MLFRKQILFAAFAMALPVFGQSDGLDIATAIPIAFGQNIDDVMDAGTRPRQVYRIPLARGQRVVASLTIPQGRPAANLAVYLFAPTTRALANMSCGNANGALAWKYDGGSRAATFDYQVANPGDYYVVVCPYLSTGVQYRFVLNAEGGIQLTPLPAQAGCLFGQVDFIEFSLQKIYADLPDRLSIGGVEACPNCTAKPPIYGAIVRKLEEAMRYGLNAEACYDGQGNIFKVKLQR